MKVRTICWLVLFTMHGLASASENKEQYPLTIKIIRAETVPLAATAATDPGCDAVAYSPNCLHSSAGIVQNRMTVQLSDGQVFTIACKIEVKWSRCIPLPVGESFRARIGKDGLSVLYLGAKGQTRRHEYRVISNLSETQVGESAPR